LLSTLLSIAILLFALWKGLRKPVYALAVYYVTAITTPHLLWPGNFGNIRLNFWAAIITLTTFMLKLLRDEKYRNQCLLRGFSGTKYLIVFAVLINISYFFPFVFPDTPSADLGISNLLFSLNTMLVFCIIATFIVDSEESVIVMVVAFIVAQTMLVYWSNKHFLFFGYGALSADGRMPGPMGQDANVFATRILVGLPFLMFAPLFFKKKYLKYAGLIVVPLAWHSIYLTGSRGGLLALLLLMALLFLKLPSLKLKGLLTLAFLAMLATQAGPLIDRIQRSLDEAESVEVDKINPRIESWKAGLGIIVDVPMRGVGFERFQIAGRYYGHREKYVAHNTFIQIAANSGLIAGLIYLYILFLATKRYLMGNLRGQYTSNVQMATSLGLIGFGLSSIFLNLLIYEMFYYLVAMSIACHRLLQETD